MTILENNSKGMAAMRQDEIALLCHFRMDARIMLTMHPIQIKKGKAFFANLRSIFAGENGHTLNINIDCNGLMCA